MLRTEKSEPKGGRASPPRKSSPRPETRAEVRKNPAVPPPLAPEERLRGLLVRAEVLRAEGRCEEALPLYQEYLRARRDPGVLNNYGACLWLEGRLSEADRVFRQALKLKNDPLIRLNLVLLALERGDLENACRQFRFLTGNLSDPSARSLYEAARIRLKGRCVRNR
ncbi:hypothetical protein [Thermosulfurimonas sp. F29]|uniref:hypothetical protein n=1 Tax=Thermosulfurimonas sp. F29 TaxID=2867247 RepID=UPI001C83B186|nr:hypothetical protein [Thermosulfurimonas sp. F29]MBX6422137.1 hypothetical protein [Thermosulfurimonas sp. F29]